ncbi:hypothetical protein AGABI2DRAFT_179381 [Agaricus bisporus var. bisporus H97]|uniref:hypothetical protein n=1 Tax=Agaricus bisporus var. bisporus (strain H97 / ATCC MYA-4626 / FGSC 10389) TaxID=936046 RepID=UPI00029F7367|nr:hypothetical protein AGABI2DRAFT_179381 [Agaricus bisporus var. bisporus H97]EKV45930.1 hypothetical protein AGABI2DRAFT_179381 [Agaricus bisporus var. bisporus H97]
MAFEFGLSRAQQGRHRCGYLSMTRRLDVPLVERLFSVMRRGIRRSYKRTVRSEPKRESVGCRSSIYWRERGRNRIFVVPPLKHTNFVNNIVSQKQDYKPGKLKSQSDTSAYVFDRANQDPSVHCAIIRTLKKRNVPIWSQARKEIKRRRAVFNVQFFDMQLVASLLSGKIRLASPSCGKKELLTCTSGTYLQFILSRTRSFLSGPAGEF